MSESVRTAAYWELVGWGEMDQSDDSSRWGEEVVDCTTLVSCDLGESNSLILLSRWYREKNLVDR
jgi:hypothetical protein